MTPPTPTPHRSSVIPLLLALLLALPSCSSSSDDPSPTTAPKSEKDKVEAAYLAYSELGRRLLEAPDSADPEIALRTTGRARADLEAGLRTLKEAGRRFKVGPAYSHDVLSVAVLDPLHATAQVCVVDDSTLIDEQTGEVVAEGVTTSRWTVSLVLIDETWRVEAVDEGDPKEGAGRCE